MTTELIRENKYVVESSSTLVEFLLDTCSFLHDVSEVLNLCSQDRLLCNNKLVKTNLAVREGDELVLLTPQSLEPPVNEEISLLYEDDYFFAVAKPPQLPVHPSGKYYFNTLSSLVERKLGLLGLYPYNRLDRETSGIVLFAKKAEYVSLLQDAIIDKWYYALVFGQVLPEKGLIQEPLLQTTHGNLRHHIVVDSAGRESITQYEVVSSNEKFSLVRVKLITGRKHQIRAHFAHIGHPLVGDKEYGKFPELHIAYSRDPHHLDVDEVIVKVGSPYQLLHCYKVEFDHPKKAEKVLIEDFAGEFFLKFLKKENLELKF